MCEICNGSHVVHEDTGYGFRFDTCPNCGPISWEIRKAELLAMKHELEYQKAKRLMEGA